MEDNKTLAYKSPWQNEPVQLALRINTYDCNNNLYIGLTDFEDGYPEPFADATVNFGDEVLPAYHGFLDVGNVKGLEEFIEENGLGERTGRVKASGFNMYPLYKFNEEKLKEFDAKGVENYEKVLDEMQNSLKRKGQKR